MRTWVDDSKRFKQLINILRHPTNKNNKMEVHTHDFVEFEYVLSGHGIQMINGTEYPVKRGDLICLQKGDYHTYYTDDKMDIINIIFYYQVFDELKTILCGYSYEDIKIPMISHFTGMDLLEIENLILNAETEFNQERVGYYHVLKSCLTILLIYLMRNGLKKEKIRCNSQKILPVLEYIDQNFSDTNVTDVAKHFNYSPNYFSKFFKKNVGMSFVEYLNQKKLKQAVDLLLTTDYSVEEICEMIGFRDRKHFYTLFKQQFDTTPASFRRKVTTQNPNAPDKN